MEYLPVDFGPTITAGFTMRSGGVSDAPWDSLNLGFNVTDNPVNVASNRQRVSAQWGAPIAFSTQVHGNTVMTLGRQDRDTWAGTPTPESAGSADGLVSEVPGLGVAVLVADCVPIVLADPVTGVVATAHAGRQGVLLGVIARTVEAMKDAGARLSGMSAAVGPAICGSCYEVPQEMQDSAAEAHPEAITTTQWGTPGLDLPAAAVHQLHSLGITDVQHVNVCTREDTRFYSHRRATAHGETTGRQAGVIAITR